MTKSQMTVGRPRGWARAVVVARRAALVVVLLLPAPHEWQLAHASADVLDRPALPNAHAAKSVVLGLARAGPRIVAVGERGTILLSDDEGRSWRQARVPVSATLTGVYFDAASSPPRGWAVGHFGIVLRSDDGGESWRKQLDGRQVAAAIAAQAQAQLLRASDEASVATRQAEAQRLVAEGPDKPFFDLAFVDRDRGFIVGAYGLLFASRDGGQTWIPWQDRLPAGEARHLYRLTVQGQEIFIAGEQGALYRSRDGGDSFAALASPYEGSFFGGLTGARVGQVLLYGLRGRAFWSSDAGARWHRADTGVPASLTAGLRRDDGTLLLATQSGHLLRSADQGRHWQPTGPRLLGPAQALLETRDAALIVAGPRGVVRVELAAR